MSFLLVAGSAINEETTNIIRLNLTNLSYLDVFDVTVGTVTANYMLNTSQLYCGLLSYAGLLLQN